MSEIGNKLIFSKNLQRQIEQSGKTRAQICDELGIAYSTFSEWANGRKYPRIDKIEMLAQYFGIKKSELIEDGSPVLPQSLTQAFDIVEPTVRMIPVYSSVSAGLGRYADNCIEEYMPVFIESETEAEESIAIRVRGDSMLPEIKDGDTVVVHLQPTVEENDISVFLIDGDEGVVKVAHFVEDGVELLSYNPYYPPRKFIKEETERLRVVGKVTKIVRNCK